MRFFRDCNKLPLICGVLGVLGLGLRFWLLHSAVDEKGLLDTSHPAQFLTAAAALLAVAAVAASLWDREDIRSGKGMFPASRVSAFAAGAAAVGFALGAWEDLSQAASFLDKVTGIAGFLAALAAVFFGYCRFRGLRPHFSVGGIITVYLMLHLVRHYQQWFSEPQLTVYLPRLLAQVLLMVACYQKTALEAGLGGRKLYIIASQLAGFFCLVSLPCAENPAFYLAMAVWMLLDGGDLSLPDRGCKEAA